VSPVKYELGFYIPEDDILHSHRRENLKSYILRQMFTKVPGETDVSIFKSANIYQTTEIHTSDDSTAATVRTTSPAASHASFARCR
jgi:hypothetical protein